MITSKTSYAKAKALLETASSKEGFLASAQDISNYRRIWARDGVICGLAALLDGDHALISTFKDTLDTLAANQHKHGHIPSNVFFGELDVELSFGGLAGRVDTISWFIIGVCNYVHFTSDEDYLHQLLPQINKGLDLLEAWEFNNNDLIYVPRSGNWADEYITEGHTVYDQALRLWALRALHKLKPTEAYGQKIEIVTEILSDNYRSGKKHNVYHPNAYRTLEPSKFWQASITPSGYQTMFDAFGNALMLLLGVGDSSFQETIVNYSENLRKELPLRLLPAFWEPIEPGDTNWKLLEDNCKYEFRNYPNTFHNGGTWQMVNGFYGISLSTKHSEISKDILQQIETLNEVEDFSFYENFNSETKEPNGVPKCTWSAAGQIMLSQYLQGEKLLM